MAVMNMSDVRSAEDWASIQETLHLLSSPKNAKRLHASMVQLDADEGTERDLIEP
ncbi:type II toxin-antitoxin system Phd/YefM family antitoxin [Celeribacter sp. ULVN23_4]